MNSTIPMSFAGRSVIVAAMLALSSCGGGSSGGTPPAEPATRPITQSDLQIAENIYRGGARTPAGFYSEPQLSGHAYVSTQHLKNSDLDDSMDASEPLHELCTDDWNEALAWSELNAQDAPLYADLVETNDDARFHEFGRVQTNDPQFLRRERVFKCSYLDRSTADLRAESGPAGQFTHRPLTAAELQRLSEYLWQFTPYNNFGSIVLKSSGAETADGLSHTLHIGHLAREDDGECDRIDVLAWKHAVDASTGELQLSVETLWSFGAREQAGVVEVCSSGGE